MSNTGNGGKGKLLGELITLLYNQKMSSENKNKRVNMLLNNSGLVREINSMSNGNKKKVHKEIYGKLEKNGFNTQHKKLETYLGIVKAHNSLKNNRNGANAPGNGNGKGSTNAAANGGNNAVAKGSTNATANGGNNAAAKAAASPGGGNNNPNAAASPGGGNNNPKAAASPGGNNANAATLAGLNRNLQALRNATNNSPELKIKLKQNLAKYMTNSSSIPGTVNEKKINNTALNELIKNEKFTFSMKNVEKLKPLVPSITKNGNGAK